MTQTIRENVSVNESILPHPLKKICKWRKQACLFNRCNTCHLAGLVEAFFLRAPLACCCARTTVKSTSSVCRASSCCTAAKIRAQMTARAQRGKRVCVVCQLPRSAGRAH